MNSRSCSHAVGELSFWALGLSLGAEVRGGALGNALCDRCCDFGLVSDHDHGYAPGLDRDFDFFRARDFCYGSGFAPF